MTNQRCRATNRAGEPCGRYAISGGYTCPTHGSSAPQVAIAAKRRVIQAEAQSIVAALGNLPELEDPETALMQTVQEYIAIKDVLRMKASELSDVAVTSRIGEQAVAATLQAYLSSLDHVSAILVKIVKIPALTDRPQRTLNEDVRNTGTALRAALNHPQFALSHETQRQIQSAFADELAKLYETDEEE